jgi:hypothetical protein
MRIYCYGLGAIGSNLIVQLMKQFPEHEYYGLDYDKIEDRNIKTQAYFLEHIGMPKTHAVPVVAQRFLRKLNYKPLNQKLEKTPSNLNEPDTLHIDCFDNPESRRLLHTGKAKNVLHVGFSPFYTAEMLWDDSYDVPGAVDPAQNDICEMEEAASFIQFVVNFAVMNVTKYFNDEVRDNYIITDKFRIKKL